MPNKASSGLYNIDKVHYENQRPGVNRNPYVYILRGARKDRYTTSP
jgi:hypothetical protein